LHDAYKSISEALIHAGAVNFCSVDLKWIHSETLEVASVNETLAGLDGIIVAPGFGHRGIDGKVRAAGFARENNIPYLGICLGMQVAVIEFARNVLNMKGADSTEMNPKTSFPVIDLMEHQKEITDYGGTMRLGAYECIIMEKDSKACQAYNKLTVFERHRHRYEFNDAFRKSFEEAGMVPVGINPETELIEIMEIPKHKWFVGVQFHPEYRSTVLNPHPLFIDFIRNSLVIEKNG